MNTATHPRRTSQRLESAVQIVILLAIATMAAAASFTHVHNLAAAHGQSGWLAWADAVVLELMSIATGLEIRRRHRAGRPAGFVLVVLVAAVALSLSAQVVEAEPSIIGWLAAALPAAGFLALVKIVMTRTPARTTPASAEPPLPDRADHRPLGPALHPAAPGPGENNSRSTGRIRDTEPPTPDIASPIPSVRALTPSANVATAAGRSNNSTNPDASPQAPAPARPPEADPEPDPSDGPVPTTDEPARPEDSPTPPAPTADTSVAVAYWYRTNPTMHPADVAARIGKSERTVRRYWPPPPAEPADGAARRTNGGPQVSPAESSNHH